MQRRRPSPRTPHHRTTATTAAVATAVLALAACGPGPDEGMERSDAARLVVTPADAPASADANAADH